MDEIALKLCDICLLYTSVHLLFCCKYSQRELESCSSSSPPPTSTSCPFAFLHGRPRHGRGRFSFAGASCGACCRCAAAWWMHHVVEHRPSSAPQHGQGAQRRAQDHRRNRDPRAQVNFLSFCSGFGIEVQFFTWYNL